MKEQILLILWVIGLWFSFCLVFKNEHIISKTETKNISIIRNSQEMSTYTCSRMIFVNRFLRFWWKFSGKRARIASAEDRSRNAASLVRRCRAWSSCKKDGDKGGEEKRAETGDREQGSMPLSAIHCQSHSTESHESWGLWHRYWCPCASANL